MTSAISRCADAMVAATSGPGHDQNPYANTSTKLKPRLGGTLEEIFFSSIRNGGLEIVNGGYGATMVCKRAHLADGTHFVSSTSIRV